MELHEKKNYRYKKIAPLIKGVPGDTRVEGRGIKIYPTGKRGLVSSHESWVLGRETLNVGLGVCCVPSE